MATTDMITADEYLARVLAGARPLPPEHRSLAAAYGCVLAAPIVSAIPAPPFDNSAMDGYAVRASDLRGTSVADPVGLRVVGEIAAGPAGWPRLAPGEALRIMTGAAVPPEADAIIPIEQTLEQDWDAEDIHIPIAPLPHAYIRFAGSDLAPGNLVLDAGVRVDGYVLATVATTAAIAELSVRPAPRVALVTTGDELAEPGALLRRGQIPDSNGPLLVGLITEAGGRVVFRERVGDEAGEVEAAVERAAASAVDLIVLSGGVSVGRHDPVARLPLMSTTVRLQPGRPQAFGRLYGVPTFGLPGNPVSIAVSFELFVRAYLLRLQGARVISRPRVPMRAAEGWSSPPDLEQYLPVRVDPVERTVRPAHAGGSASFHSGRLALTDGFAIVPAAIRTVRPGDPVEAIVWRLS